MFIRSLAIAFIFLSCADLFAQVGVEKSVTRSQMQLGPDSVAIFQIDSLNNILNSSSKLDIENSKLYRYRDSLNADLISNQTYLESINNKFKVKKDSVSRLTSLAQAPEELIDSINNQHEKLVRQVNDKISELQARIETTNLKINKPINNLESQFNQSLDQIDKQNIMSNLPEHGDLPALHLPVETDQFDEGSGFLDDAVPSTKNSDNDLISPLNANGLSTKVDRFQDPLEELSTYSNQLSGYANDLSNISNGNVNDISAVPEKIESEAVSYLKVDQLAESEMLVDEKIELLKSGNDQEALKELAIQQAPKLAKNHFNGHEAALQETVGKVTELKRKYIELSNLEDLPKGSFKTSEKPPLRERLIPGITFQLQQSNNFWIDYHFGLGYLISEKLSAGLGWNERISISGDFELISNERIYGPRAFIDYKLRKGFSMHADIETMNTKVITASLSGDESNNEWVWGAFAGIKKQYDFIKNTKGNFQLLYNLLGGQNASPYTNRISIRFGFEFPFKHRNNSKPQLEQ